MMIFIFKVLIGFCVLCVAYYALKAFVEACKIFEGYRTVQKRRDLILAVPGVFTCLFSDGEHIIRGECIYVDTRTSVVVIRQGVISGIIGFQLRGSVLRIEQLQGVKRGRFHDVHAGAYLLEVAEQVAHALGAQEIWVLAAEYVEYYSEDFLRQDLPPDKAYALLEKRRQGMHRMYDDGCKRSGYLREYAGSRWWKKYPPKWGD